MFESKLNLWKKLILGPATLMLAYMFQYIDGTPPGVKPDIAPYLIGSAAYLFIVLIYLSARKK